MQILVFVLAILSALTILTYANLSTFVSRSHIQNEYRKVFQSLHQKAPNDLWSCIYDTYKTSSANGDTENSEKPPKLSSRLNMRGLIKKEEADRPQFGAARRLFQRLIHYLYSEHRFYREFMIAQDAEGKTEEEVIEWLIETIIENSPFVEQKHGAIKYPMQLSLIEFPDNDLRQFFIKILAGAGGTDSDEMGKIPSIADYISLQGNKKTSIFYARRELLLAIFNDDRLVEEIIAKRNDLSRQLRRNAINLQEASQELKNMLGGATFTDADDDILDFSVSKSIPRA